MFKKICAVLDMRIYIYIYIFLYSDKMRLVQRIYMKPVMMRYFVFFFC